MERNRERRKPRLDEGTSHLESETMREQQRRALEPVCAPSIKEQQGRHP